MHGQSRSISRALTSVLLMTLAACGNGGGDEASRTPTPTVTATPADFHAFVGTYDLTSSGDSASGLFGDGLATASFLPSGELAISLLFDIPGDLPSSAQLSGSPRPDGTVTLAGSGIVSGDIAFRLSGSAVLTTAFGGVDIQRIAGSMRSESSFPVFSNEFTLERPTSGTSTGLGGVCRLALGPSPSGCGCPSTATMHLAVPADGLGRSSLAFDDRDADEASLGTFAPGDCLVSPRGRIHCGLEYVGIFPTPADPVPRPAGLFLLMTGELEQGFGVTTGSGRIATPPPSFPFVATAWSAVCEPAERRATP
jgi:hypothetical protein